jgi:hypothetical protein
MRNGSVFLVAMSVLGFAGGFFAGRSIRPSTPESINREASASPGPKVAALKLASHYSSFTWSQVESQDLQRYIANLRRIGCPERTIGDIIRARVFAMFQAKVDALLDPLARYWNTAAEMKALDAQIKAIRQERDKLLADLHLEDSTFDPRSGLPPEKQAAVADALRLYPKLQSDPSWGPQEWQSYLQAQKARINYLAQYLTPDELLDYRISQDGSPSTIARLLQDINPTDDEFKKVFEALDGESLSRTNGVMAPDLQSKLQQALGADRYAEYMNEQTGPDHFFNTLVSTYNLNEDQVQQLKQLLATADAMTAADYRQATGSILQNPSAVRMFLMISHKPMNP